MALLDRLERRASPENPSTNLSDPSIWPAFGYSKNASGVSVNEVTALNQATVFACVSLLSSTLATLPLVVYEKLERGRREAINHRLYWLLKEEANAELPAFAWRELSQAHVVTWGNTFSEIEFNGRGDPVGLWPLLPDRTYVERRNGERIVVTRLPDGKLVGLPSSRVLHIPGLGFDGLTGYSVIRMAAQTIGLAMATEEFGARHFGQGSRPSGVLKSPKPLSDKARTNVRESWDLMHSGLSNSHRIAILEEGLEWQQTSISPEDSQYLETRQFQSGEIAKIFRVPPHMVGDTEKSTSWGTGIEQQSIGFVTYTLLPWLVRWEKWIQRTLFTERELGTYYAEFKQDALLRGDKKSRAEASEIERRNGIINADEWRERENMNPQDGDQGSKYILQNVWTPADKVGEVAPTAPMAPATQTNSLAPAFEKIFRHSADGVVRRQANAARNAIKKGDLASFRLWVDEFFEKEPEQLQRALTPIAESYSEARGETVTLSTIETFTRTAASESAAQLRACLLEPESAEARIGQMLSEWEQNRAGDLARVLIESLN